MSAAIQASLQNLNKAVQHLETAVVSVQSKKTKPAKSTPQDDLFAVMTGGKSATNGNNLNVRQIADRLDVAINQVEKILKEGRA